MKSELHIHVLKNCFFFLKISEKGAGGGEEEEAGELLSSKILLNVTFFITPLPYNLHTSGRSILMQRTVLSSIPQGI